MVTRSFVEIHPIEDKEEAYQDLAKTDLTVADAETKTNILLAANIDTKSKDQLKLMDEKEKAAYDQAKKEKKAK